MDEDEEFEFALALEQEEKNIPSVQEYAAPKKEKYDPLALSNIVGSAVEPLMTLGSGAVAMPAAGIAGLMDYLGGSDGGNNLQESSDTVNKVLEALTYSPRTEGGQMATDAIMTPFKKMHEGAEYAGQKTLDATGSPSMAAIVDSVLKLAPMAVGAKYAPKGKPTFPKVEQGIKDVAGLPLKGAKSAYNVVENAVMNRMPNNAGRVIGQTVNEMVGPRKQAVISALEQAKIGETAGQAATGAGSFEFSALQKMAEGIKPSEFGAIKSKQQTGRQTDLAEIAKTPLKEGPARHALESAKLNRKTATDPLYEAGRAGPSRNIEPIISKLDELAAKNPGNAELLTDLSGVRKGLVDEKGVPRGTAQEVLSAVDGLKKTIQNTKDGFVKGELTAIKNKIIETSPFYKEGQRVFSEMSKPINRMEVGNVLSEALDPRLGSVERASAFSTARANAPQTIKKATGQPRFNKLEDVLVDKEMGVVNKVQGQLNRDVTLKQQATQGAKAMNKAMGTMFDSPRLGILERSIVIANAIMKRIEGKNTSQALNIVADKMMNPREMANLMKKATPKERASLSEFNDMITQTATGSAIGAAGGQ